MPILLCFLALFLAFSGEALAQPFTRSLTQGWDDPRPTPTPSWLADALSQQPYPKATPTAIPTPGGGLQRDPEPPEDYTPKCIIFPEPQPVGALGDICSRLMIIGMSDGMEVQGDEDTEIDSLCFYWKHKGLMFLPKDSDVFLGFMHSTEDFADKGTLGSFMGVCFGYNF